MWLWQSHLVPVYPSQTLWDRQPSQHFAQFLVILQQLGVPSLHVTLAGIIGTPQYTDCSNQLLPLSAVADAGYQSAHWTKRTRRSIPPARAALARKRHRQNQSARRTRTGSLCRSAPWLDPPHPHVPPTQTRKGRWRYRGAATANLLH